MYKRVGKRVLDLVLGSALVVIALPVIFICASVSALAFRAWPIFVQPRVGLGGRVFAFPKIRTLPPRACAAADKYALKSVSIPRWAQILRRTHLDELPQLLLVPFGKMSLVGPRPEMPAMYDRYPHVFMEARLSVRPGCTGLWQISDASSAMIYEAPEYDLVYVEQISFRLDLWVLWRSPFAMFSRAVDRFSGTRIRGVALPESVQTVELNVDSDLLLDSPELVTWRNDD
jgi:lipopolysaccharide/colanic/teichoic acid biosynthesis glycosyltransferase